MSGEPVLRANFELPLRKSLTVAHGSKVLLSERPVSGIGLPIELEVYVPIFAVSSFDDAHDVSDMVI
jgi:hypothetical protein